MGVKRQFLEDILKKSFNIDLFTKLVKEIFMGAEYLALQKKNEKIGEEFKLHIDSCSYVARLKDRDENKILVLAVKLKNDQSIDSTRNLQRYFISQLFTDTEYDGVIAAFYQENDYLWKLSLFRPDKEGALKVLKTSQPLLKRLSFLAGKGEPCSTAADQIMSLLEGKNSNPTLDELEQAFSREALIKDFFELVKEKYAGLTKYLDNNQSFQDKGHLHGFSSEQFAKRLIIQLVFLYILQKKRGLGTLRNSFNNYFIPNELFSNTRGDGILDVFDRYNYTLNEEEPLESEVAVGPAILGRIFEGLSGSQARKSRGVFYTPREIVLYMSQECLINYLVKELGSPSEDMRKFILFGDLDVDDKGQTLLKIDNALKNVKVVEPAVGSGAFLLGIFLEIVRARTNITLYLAKLLKTSGEREELHNQIRHPYQIKVETVRNSLFAMDIDSNAVEVAKLRLGLSLLVHEEFPESRGFIPSLSSLTSNILCGNSLIEGYNEEFDIVIGNPPYVDSEEMTRSLPKLREYCNTNFHSAKGNWDLFVVFIEQGLRLLRQGGTISYIVPNKLISADYTRALRRFVSTYKVQEIRDYSNVDIFAEAHVYPIIFRFEKESNNGNSVKMVVMNSITDIDWENEVSGTSFYQDINWDRYFLKDSSGIKIINKMLRHSKLGDIAVVKGAATVNEAYRIKDLLLEYSDVITGDYKRFINTGTIDRYESLWGKYPTRYIKNSYLKPVILREDLLSVSKTRVLEAAKEKIIIAGMTKNLECFYDKGNYLAGKSTVIVLEDTEDLRYLTALLNSRLITYFYRSYFNSLSLAGGYLRIGPSQIREIPIAMADDNLRNELISLVDKIPRIMNKRQDLIASELRELLEEINEIVYLIYGLSQAEIKLVESST